MLHEIAKACYQEYHRMGFALELAVLTPSAMEQYYSGDEDYICGVVCNLFTQKDREPYLGFIALIGDTESDPEKPSRFDCTLAQFNIYANDGVMIKDAASVLNMTNALFSKVLGKDTGFLYAREAELNEYDASIIGLRLSDMGDVLDGKSGEITPHIEYQLNIVNLGNVDFIFTDETLVNHTANVKMDDINSVKLQRMLNLSGQNIQNMTEIITGYADNITKTCAAIIANVALPYVEDDIVPFLSIIRAV